MASPNRLQKINEEILRELSAILGRLKDPRIQGVVSITRVDTSRDLSQAKVFVSVLGGDAEAVTRVLKTAAAHVRHELALALSLRHTPALHFTADHSIEHGAMIQEKLSHLFPDGVPTDENTGENSNS